MFKCVSLLLAVSLAVNSSAAWTGPTTDIVESVPEVQQEYIVEDAIEEPAIDIYEEPVVEDVPTEPEVYLTEEEIDLVALVTMAEAEALLLYTLLTYKRQISNETNSIFLTRSSPRRHDNSDGTGEQRRQVRCKR